MDFGGDIGHWQRKIAECPEGFARRQSTLRALAVEPNRAYLDVGCGGGHLVNEIGLVMGGNGRIVGIDPSADQVIAAQGLCKNISIAELSEGDATQ